MRSVFKLLINLKKWSHDYKDSHTPSVAVNIPLTKCSSFWKNSDFFHGRKMLPIPTHGSIQTSDFPPTKDCLQNVEPEWCFGTNPADHVRKNNLCADVSRWSGADRRGSSVRFEVGNYELQGGRIFYNYLGCVKDLKGKTFTSEDIVKEIVRPAQD